MDPMRARSPPPSLGRRPIGPRSPGKPGTLPVKNIIPLDLTARLQDEFGVLPRTASPDTVAFKIGPSGSRPASPASAPVHLRNQTSVSSRSSSPSRPPSSQKASLRRVESSKSGKAVSAGDDAEGNGPPQETETVEEKRGVKRKSGAGSDIAALDATPPSPIPLLDASTPPPAIGTDVPVPDDWVDAFSPEPRAAAPFSLEPPAMTGIPTPPAPVQESLDAGDMPASPMDDAAAEILGLYLPPPVPPPIASLEEESTSAVPPSPPPPEVNGTSIMTGINGSGGFNGFVDSKGVNGHPKTPSERSVRASVTASESSPTPTSTRASTPALLKTIPKRPPLSLPLLMNFDFEPVPWKGMTLDAAQWTFTSEQLQETVSRAIRQSAQESFIRVLSTETHDVELPQELKRLESLRATTQAQYRFNMHRRAMLLQSLAALSQSQPDADGEALYNLTTQLAEITVSCDRLIETLMSVADRKAQIQHVQDLHVSSALAMALRKLNASYAKRSAELQDIRARNDELKAELEEAWNMAQDMAQEMDDLDNFNLEFSDEEFTPEDEQPSNSALEAEIYSDMDRMSAVSSMRNAEVIEITGKAVATKATFANVAGAMGQQAGDRTSRVSAAKKRSSRTSKASLRVPKTPTSGAGERERRDRTSIYSIRSRRSRSKSVRKTDHGEASNTMPDVPIIRLPEPNRSREGSFLELSQTRPGTPAAPSTDAPPPLPPKQGLEPMMNAVATRSEELLPAPYGQNPPPSPMSGSVPAIAMPEDAQRQPPKGPSWAGRRFFARRVHSMQPPVKAADDTAAPQLQRSQSDYKQFDGWPFLNVSKTQRFSVPVLAAIQSNKARKSSDSAPVGHS